MSDIGQRPKSSPGPASTLRPEGSTSALRSVALMALGTALLAVSAKVNLPLPLVPMTLQTLVIVMIGATFGRWLAITTVLAYLAAGAAGLPVFAGTVSGLAPLVGPTGGYLFGFIPAAFLIAVLCKRGADSSFIRLFGSMVLAHAVLLTTGAVWLALGKNLGAEKAFMVGIVPFLAGAVVKSALGAALVPPVRRIIARQG